jgi:pyrroloquinoline-quinone synthase
MGEVHRGTSRQIYRTRVASPMSEAPWDRFEGEAFREELTKFKMAHHPFKTHPFFAELEHGKVSKATVQRWAGQFYPWLACVPLAMAERFSRCSWESKFDPFRRMILDQLVEEAGDPKGKEPGHPELWLRFCEGLGVSREKMIATTVLPSTLVAIDDFLYINKEVPFYVSAAGSSEPPNVELCQRLLPAFRNHYKVPESHLTYYTLHVTADEEHSRWVGEMVAAFANTPEIRRQMWDAMLRGFALHRLLVDGVIAASTGETS